jgi:zinc/manganese transport system permease protein
VFSSFMVNTWIAVTIVALVAGVVGLLVVIRDSAFAAHALPLGAFPGAAAASLLGLNPLIGLLAFAGLGVFGIARLRGGDRREVVTALTLVTLLGMGALFLSLTSQYSSEIFALLFGQVLGVSGSAIPPMAIVGVLVIAATIGLFRPLLLSSVSPELADALGVSSRRMELVFLTLLALATVLALPVVGALLVFSLMVGPPAAARAFARQPGSAMVLSVAIALPTAWLAVALAYLTDWPVGFFIGMLGAAAYGVGAGWAAWQRARATLVAG